jgi:hypothetical protein
MAQVLRVTWLSPLSYLSTWSPAFVTALYYFWKASPKRLFLREVGFQENALRRSMLLGENYSQEKDPRRE